MISDCRVLKSRVLVDAMLQTELLQGDVDAGGILTATPSPR
jgi:hypothetical protein